MELLGSGRMELAEQTHAAVPWNGTVAGEACVMLPLRCSIAAMATFLLLEEPPSKRCFWAPLGAAECSLLYAVTLRPLLPPVSLAAAPLLHLHEAALH